MARKYSGHGTLGFIALSLFCAFDVSAQFQNLPPELRREARNPDEAAYRQIQQQRELESQQQQAMRESELNGRSSAQLPRDRIPHITEKERERIKALLEPHPEDLEAHKNFLEMPRTGIFRLFPDSDCEANWSINVGGACANHIPGGSNFSFRPGAMTPDIHFNRGRIIADGFFAQSFFVEFGDIEIQDLEAGDPLLQPVYDFQPAKDHPGAKEQYRGITKGLSADGRTLTRSIAPQTNRTYVVRVIAYRNGQGPTIGPAIEFRKNSPEEFFRIIRKEKRLDIIVVFRVIRQEQDGSLSILWRELSRKKSPEIKFKDGQQPVDFR